MKIVDHILKRYRRKQFRSERRISFFQKFHFILKSFTFKRRNLVLISYLTGFLKSFKTLIKVLLISFLNQLNYCQVPFFETLTVSVWIGACQVIKLFFSNNLKLYELWLLSVECVMNEWSNACSLIKKLKTIVNISKTEFKFNYYIVEMS